MALFRPSELRERARTRARFTEGVQALLLERMVAQVRVEKHDIFMSHAFDDKELILGAVLIIEDMGYSVYLDWRDDPKLDRKQITATTAAVLRERMKNSRCLFYATTESASSSKWMPWELGYKDGDNTRAAILPFSDEVTSNFTGQEYLGIYPYVSEALGTQSGKRKLWIHRSPTIYVSFDEWLAYKEPYQH